MKEINYTDIQGGRLIDIRSQYAFQAGHAKGSLNLNPSNFKKYLQDFLTSDQSIIIIAGQDNLTDIDALSEYLQEIGYVHIKGYLLAENIPAEKLEILETIPANDFLNLSDNYILLDVRQPAEITRPAPKQNLMNIPFEELPHSLASLDNHIDIYTLCGSGNRSTAAASYLLSKGFQTKVIEGGVKAIQEAQV